MILGIMILLVSLILGFPIYLGLLLSGLYILVGDQGTPVTMVVIGLYDGVAKFTLLAVPFFLLAGAMMESSSMARRLVGCFTPWLAHVRGGIPMAGIFANELFGAISGSAPAAAGTIGRAMVPLVTQTNGEKFALGLFTSAGALAIIMPPSIAMILFATATNASIGALFLAGVIPAIIIGIFVAVYVYFKSPARARINDSIWHSPFRAPWRAGPSCCFPFLCWGVSIRDCSHPRRRRPYRPSMHSFCRA